MLAGGLFLLARVFVLIKKVAVVLGNEPVFAPRCFFETFHVFRDKVVSCQFIFHVYIAVAGFASPFLADVIGQVFHPDDCVNAVGEEEVIVLGVHVDFKRSGIVPVIEFNEQEHCFDEAALVLAGCRIGMGQILGDTPGIVAEIDETVHGIAVRDDMAVAVEFSGIIGWV